MLIGYPCINAIKGEGLVMSFPVDLSQRNAAEPALGRGGHQMTCFLNIYHVEHSQNVLRGI